MAKENRAKVVYKNSLMTLGTQALQVLLSFLVRKIFIHTLGVSYLGYNSVFLNILQMLNLADLGIGVAITSFLYKPLAEGDKEKIKALMFLYKKIYNIMGLIVIVLGFIISLFLGYLIPDSQTSITYLRILFYINLVGTVSTYFLAYKRTLIIADQKSYITNMVDAIIFFAVSGLQILFLELYPNYIIYLALNVAKSIISNMVLSVKCNKLYGKFNEKVNNQVVEEFKPQVFNYVKDLFVSKIGAVIYFGTDNVIISVFRGSLLAGFLSNYTMITTYLTTIISQLLGSLQATFGNYVNSDKSLAEQKKMTDNYFCANFIIGNFCMLCFVMLVQPFIKIYFGDSLLLPYSTALLLGINLMLSLMIQLPSQIFTIYKLFRYDRPIIITSALLNIVISIILVRKIGVDGVLIGTLITSLIYLFSRFYIISKKVFYVDYSQYVCKILLYFILSAITLAIAFFVCDRIHVVSWIIFLIKSLLIVGIAIFIPAFALSFTKEFQFLIYKMTPKKLLRFIKPSYLGVCGLVIVIISFVVGSYS